MSYSNIDRGDFTVESQGDDSIRFIIWRITDIIFCSLLSFFWTFKMSHHLAVILEFKVSFDHDPIFRAPAPCALLLCSSRFSLYESDAAYPLVVHLYIFSYILKCILKASIINVCCTQILREIQIETYLVTFRDYFLWWTERITSIVIGIDY